MNEIMYNTISNKKNVFVANSILSIRTRNNIKTCVYNIAYKNRWHVSLFTAGFTKNFDDCKKSMKVYKSKFLENYA